VNRKNSLYFFVSIFLVFMIVGQIVLESRYFARWINENFIIEIAKQNKLEMSFERLSLNLSQKRIMLNGVKISNNLFSIDGNIGFGLNLDLILSKQLKVSNIVIDKAKVNYRHSNNSKIEKKFEIHDFISDMMSKNGIKDILAKNVVISCDVDGKMIGGEVNSLSLKRVRSDFNFSLTLHHNYYQSNTIDELDVSGVIARKKNYIKKLVVKSGLSRFGISNNLVVDNDLNIKGEFTYKLFYEDLVKAIPGLPQIHKNALASSYADGDVSLFFNNKELDLFGSLMIRSFNQDMSVKNIKLNYDYKNGKVKISNIIASGVENGQIKSDEITFDFEDRKLLMAESIKVSSFKILPRDPLLNKYTYAWMGAIVNSEISIENSSDEFRVLFNDVLVKGYCLKNKKFEDVLCAGDLEGQIILKRKKDWSIYFDTTVARKKIIAKANIDEVGFRISTEEFNYDPTILPKLFGLKLFGAGKLKASYNHSIGSKDLFISGQLDRFLIQEFNLGNINASVNYDFVSNLLIIKKARGIIGDTNYNGFGEFNFNTKQTTTSLNINLPKFNVGNLLLIMPAYLGKSKEIISKFNSFGRGNVKISGPLDVGELSIVGHIDGREITLYQEDFQNYNAVVTLENKKLLINPFNLGKNNSVLSGHFGFDFRNDSYNLDLKTKKINLNNFYYYRKFNIGMKSDVLFDLNISSENGLQLDGRLFNSSLRHRLLGESSFSLVLNEKDRKFSADLFNNKIKIQTGLKMKEPGIPYFLNTNFNIPDIDLVLGILSLKNIEGSAIEGAINFDLNSSGKIKEISNTNIDLDISEFSIRRNNLQLALVYPRNRIHVKKGKVIENGVLLSGPNQEVSLNLINKNKNIFLDLDFNIPGSVFELFPQFVSFWNGEIEGSGKVKLFDPKTFHFNLSAIKNEVRINNAPEAFQDLRFNIYGDYNFINIDEMHSRIGGGAIDAEGYVELQVGFPKIDLNYSLASAKINITDDSKVNIGGYGRIFGSSKPYFFNGSLSIINGEILDDPKLFFNRGKDLGDSSTSGFELFDFNVDINTISPILVKNSLSDLRVGGNIKYKGNNNKQGIDGIIKIAENESKLYFKGHEFKVTKGDIRFRKNADALDPYFDLVSDTKIGDYNLEMEINGDVKNLNVAFRSDPPLAEPDILSLLTLGITLDTTKDLQDSELESVTSMSLGSLLIDQFGINQGLHDSLGVKLSVGPEFNDYNNPISGKLNSSNDTSRLRSATKLRLSKRISNSINLNYSSTLGGSLDQSQQMNINLKINNDMSLQGVYRTQSNENSESIDNNESVGFDFIWKKTFK